MPRTNDPHPRGSTTANGKAKRLVGRTGGKPRKPGPSSNHVKTDITVPPAYYDAVRRVSKRDGIPLFEWHRLAVLAYAKELVARPIEPRPVECPACRRPFKATRAGVGNSDLKRVRETVNFDNDTIECMRWIAGNFYHGTWSQAFEAAERFFLGKDAPDYEKRGGVL
jgi:hypothetical protein